MRIVAGAFRGRRLVAPKGDTTRPTADRVRQALFDVLGDLGGTRVLDLWAGTGALGLEALSRGAARAVFVECDRAAHAALAANIEALGVRERAVPIRARVEQCAPAAAPHGPFDLVFADPPWAELDHAIGELARVVGAVGISPEGRLVVEHPAPGLCPTLAGFPPPEERRWGGTGVAIFRVSG